MVFIIDIIGGINKFRCRNMTAEYNGKPLSECSIEELEAFKLAVGETIEKVSGKQSRSALKTIVNLVKENNFTVMDVIKALREADALEFGKDAQGNTRPTYYNPEFPLDIYSTFGRKPTWFTKLEESGEDIEKYRIHVD